MTILDDKRHKLHCLGKSTQENLNTVLNIVNNPITDDIEELYEYSSIFDTWHSTMNSKIYTIQCKLINDEYQYVNNDQLDEADLEEINKCKQFQNKLVEIKDVVQKKISKLISLNLKNTYDAITLP